MFVDASAIIALMTDEPEAERVSSALVASTNRFTSPVAVLEVALGLARPDKFNAPVSAVEPMIVEFLAAREIEVRDLPPARETTRLALWAADRYRAGRHGLNLGDCLHYAAAKYNRAPILATALEFASTDVETVP